MKTIWKKPLVLFLSLTMFLSSGTGVLTYGETQSQGPTYDGTQSGWAEPEIDEAYAYGLTYPGVMENFTRLITREEFCTLAVKLHESLTGQSVSPGSDPFDDTDNPEILKAYKLGIVNGISDTAFAPQNNITRQEICVMIYRALDTSLPSLDKSAGGDFPFDDQALVAAWADDAVRFAYKNGIMKGMGNNLMAPLANTTREQAMVLLKRTFVSNSGVEPQTEATIPIFKPTLKILDEHTKFQIAKEEGNDLVFPKLDERLSLYVSTTSEKPSVKPSNIGIFQFKPLVTGLAYDIGPKAVYTKSGFSSFVDKSDSSRWFAFTLSNASGAQKILWQVSESPFNGYEDSWRSPLGLIGSGEVPVSAREFEIDFNNLKTSRTFSFIRPISFSASYEPIPQERTIYYVRAVPVDSSGNPVGDPGKGIAILYGEPVAEAPAAESVKSSFELWTPISSAGSYTGENQDRPTYRSVIRIDSRYNQNRLFHFNGFDAESPKLAIQVSTEPFPSNGGGWPETPNLIYEKIHERPITAYTPDYPDSVFVDFTSFAKPAAEMAEGYYVKYYLRGLALKSGQSPGTWEVEYSKPVTIEYGYSAPLKWYSDSPYKRTQTLGVSKPSISIKNYVPADWPEKDYLHHYIVFQKPAASDITCNWKNSSTGEVLYPFYSHYQYYVQKGITTPEEYENEMIPRVLPVGTKVYFPTPDEGDKPWYQQLYDGIVDFFNTLNDVVESITNQVKQAYDDLQDDLIAYVVDLCPVDSLKGPFKTALEGMVATGLMSIGIPPTLPNFDQLSEMSVDYLTEVALTEAGIPQNEYTEKMLQDIAGEVQTQLNEAASHADKNPVDAAFLKLDPEFLYRPAYLEIEISNDTDKPSISGSFDVNVTFEMGYYDIVSGTNGLNLSAPSNYSYSSDASFTTALEYRNHFLYGLNGDSVDYAHKAETAIYDVFNPKVGIKVPAMKPNTSRNVRVYLEPYQSSTFTRYPEGENVLATDWDNMYFNNGNRSFTFFMLSGRFPSAREYLIESGNATYLDPETEYVFTDEHKTGTYERMQKSVSSKWSD